MMAALGEIAALDPLNINFAEDDPNYDLLL